MSNGKAIAVIGGIILIAVLARKASASPPPSPEEELLINGDFSSGVIAWSAYGADLTVLSDPDSGFFGRVEPWGGSWSGVAQHIVSGPAYEGIPVKLSGYGRAWPHNTTDSMLVIDFAPQSPESNVSSIVFPKDGQWHYYEVLATPVNSDRLGVRCGIGMPIGPGEMTDISGLSLVVV